MIDDPVLQNVRRSAGLASTTEALNALRASLQTLSERIPADSAVRLWNAVPAPLATLIQPDAALAPAEFSFDEFCQRLADREGTDVPVAVFHARTVLQVLHEAAPEVFRFDDLATHLPNDFAPLFWQPAGGKSAA